MKPISEVHSVGRDVSESSTEPTILTIEGNVVPPHCGHGDVVLAPIPNDATPSDAPTRDPKPPRWQTSLKNAIRRRSDLLRSLDLTDAPGPAAERDFPVFVTREFASRMRPGDSDDPLLRQVLPAIEEDAVVDGYIADPVGDLAAATQGGLIHKYHGRGLMITTGACAVHCRYCFRREFPYPEQSSRDQAYRPAIDYLSQNPDIEEVLLSGGDPWTMTDGSLDALMNELEAIPHLRRLRIHTRMPIVLPARITETLVDRIRGSRLTTWVVVHCNHAQEVDADVAGALARLSDAGIPLLNQSVLLRGINDDAATMIELCRRLVDLRVMPYYLHQLDRARGTSHFEVPVDVGHAIIEQMRQALPGYAVPRYVVEKAGEPSKTPLS